MTELPKRVVTDTMIGLAMPDVDSWSERVAVVLGQNPGPFTGPGTNTYLIGTGKSRILLDTGQGVPEYLPLLERGLRETGNGDQLQEIVLTHGHVDHVGGVAGIRDRWGSLAVSKMPWAEIDAELEFTAIDDGAEIQTEGATLRAVWTPGHARDHLCFHIVEDKSLFTGDVVLGAGTTVIPPDGDLGDYLASLRRLLELDISVIYPAHGPKIDSPHSKITSYLEHRALRDAQILEGVRAGVHDARGLVRRIYTDVPSFLHAAAEMSVTAHLRNLEKNGEVRREGDRWIAI